MLTQKSFNSDDEEQKTSDTFSQMQNLNYGPSFNFNRLNKISGQIDNIEKAKKFSDDQTKDSRLNGSTTNVEELFKKTQNIHNQLMQYNLNKTLQAPQQIDIRENFKKISSQLHNDCDDFAMRSQRVLFHQTHYGGQKEFVFTNDDNIIGSKSQDNKLQQKQMHHKDDKSQNQKEFSYKTPVGHKFNLKVGEQYEIKQVMRGINQKAQQAQVAAKQLDQYDIKKVQQEYLERNLEQELGVSQRKILAPTQNKEPELDIQQIFDYKDKTGDTFDKIPENLTKELLHSFYEHLEFFNTLRQGDNGEYELDEQDLLIHQQLRQKRTKILRNDILDRGLGAHVGDKERRNKGTTNFKEELMKLNQDLGLIFNDPQNKIAFIDPLEVDCDGLDFFNITDMIAERLDPRKLLDKNDNTADQIVRDFFQGRGISSQDRIKSFAPVITKEVDVQTDQTKSKLPAPSMSEVLQFPSTIQQKKSEVFNNSLFIKIKQEINELLRRKQNSTFDNSYVRLINQNILDKLNQLWQIVKEKEPEFDGLRTLQESIEQIYQYVHRLKGHHTVEGDTKAEVLLWIMQQFRDLITNLSDKNPLDVMIIQNTDQPLINETKTKQMHRIESGNRIKQAQGQQLQRYPIRVKQNDLNETRKPSHDNRHTKSFKSFDKSDSSKTLSKSPRTIKKDQNISPKTDRGQFDVSSSLQPISYRLQMKSSRPPSQAF